jgi:excisionase family DNA binding protein
MKVFRYQRVDTCPCVGLNSQVFSKPLSRFRGVPSLLSVREFDRRLPVAINRSPEQFRTCQMTEVLESEGRRARAVSVKKAADALGVGERTAWELVKQGTLPSVKLGRRRLVPLHALESLLAV